MSITCVYQDAAGMCVVKRGCPPAPLLHPTAVATAVAAAIAAAAAAAAAATAR